MSQHNPAMQDIADALSNSLDRNGSGGMRAPLDMGGYPVRNLPEGTLPTDAARISQLSAGAMPIGAVVDFAGSSAPTGYLLCFGQAVSRSDFSELFAAIGTTFGTGDGATTFNVPDLRGRVTAAPDNMGGTPANRLKSFTANDPGAAGGSDRETITTGQMPAHTHTGAAASNGAHTHNATVGDGYDGPNSYLDLGGQNNLGSRSGYIASAGAHTHTLSIEQTGGGEAHFNVQPTIILNKIIKARNS